MFPLARTAADTAVGMHFPAWLSCAVQGVLPSGRPISWNGALKLPCGFAAPAALADVATDGAASAAARPVTAASARPRRDAMRCLDNCSPPASRRCQAAPASRVTVSEERTPRAGATCQRSSLPGGQASPRPGPAPPGGRYLSMMFSELPRGRTHPILAEET